MPQEPKVQVKATPKKAKPKGPARGAKAGLSSVMPELRKLWDALEGEDDELSEPDGLSAAEVAALIGRSRSVAYERLGQLEGFLGEGVLIKSEGRFFLADTAPRKMLVTEQQRQALALARCLLERLGMPYGDAFGGLVRHLSEGRDDQGKKRLNDTSEFTRHVVFAEPALCRRPTQEGPQADALLLNQLFEACLAHRAIRFDYQSHTSPTEPSRAVRALGLVYSDAWFLKAWDPQKGIRTYAIDRLSDLKLGAIGVKPLPEDLKSFDLASHQAQAWRLVAGDAAQEVVARMPEAHALGLKHHSQCLLDDEGPWRRVRFTVGDPNEMLGYLLGIGAEVLSPDWLREKAQTRLRSALDAYTAT